MPDIHAIASQLSLAYRNRQPFEASPDSGPVSIEQAYAVQRAVWLQQVGAARPGAWKAGAPNRQSEPSAAAVFPQRIARSPACFSRTDFNTLGIEAEIALRFARDLPVQDAPRPGEEILAAIAGAHVAIELVDSRLLNPQEAGPLWRLADNLVNGGLVIGPEIPDWRNLDFAALTVRVHGNGTCLAETLGRPPLDDLFHCLPWWIDHIGGVKAGDVVTTGAWNGMHPVCLPAVVSVEFVGVGRAEVRID